MTRLFLVRHGPTHARCFVGWSDLPADLTDTQALRRLSAYLPDAALVISSDLSRAVTTADAIQGARKRLPHASALREFHFGDWEQRTFTEIAAQDPTLSRAYWETPGDIRPPGGESWNDAAARVGEKLDALMAEHAGRDLVVVAHVGVILTQVQRASGASAESVLSHRIDNLSVTEVWRDDSGWGVGPINHLP